MARRIALDVPLKGTRQREDAWKVGDVVQYAPHQWARIVKLEHNPLGTRRFKLEEVPPQWTWRERIKLAFGWRPPIGY